MNASHEHTQKDKHSAETTRRRKKVNDYDNSSIRLGLQQHNNAHHNAHYDANRRRANLFKGKPAESGEGKLKLQKCDVNSETS